MTCPEARELLSALLDDALSPAERQTVDAHLATCAECPRELAALRETVTLLKRLPPVHAPPGFVDRVVETAYRPSWPRRVADALFRPLRVKLPLEAAAVVLVGVSALYVHQHAPEVQQVARQETREATSPASAPEAPVAPSRAGDAGSAPSTTDAVSQEKPAAVEQELKREPGPPAAAPPVPAAPAPTAQRENVGPPAAAPGASASATAPAPAQEPKVTTSAEAKKEAVDHRREDTAAATSPSSTLQKQAQSAAPAPSRDTAGSRAAPAPALPQSGGAPPEARSRVGASAPVPSEEPAPEPFSVGKSRAAARLMRASDTSGRLVVLAPEPAEIAIDALLTRLGGTRVARRLEGPQGLILVDVIISAARYPELLEGLGKIGRWTTEHEPKTLPAQVRVEVAVGVER